MKFDNSLKTYKKALEIIPMGTSTFSKNPNLYTIGKAPLFIKSAKGCKILDLDGNEFIDYSMGLGTVILGYSNSEVNKAAKDGIDDGLLFTLSCREETILAQKIINLIPCADSVRFSKNGSDVCEGAIRLARNFTNKLKILTVGGYHGFHDWFIASTQRNKGIPKPMSEWIINHSYNDINLIEKTIKDHHEEIAALIMEPVINYEPRDKFLQKIRELTQKYSIILIFDEMKTGFRLDMGGAQKYFNVIPDLAVFAKAISNGFPISVLTGKKYLMKQFEDELCFLSASYATEKSSINAAIKNLSILKRDNAIDHIWKMGTVLKLGINKIIKNLKLNKVLNIVGFAPMTHCIISEYKDLTSNEIKSFLQQEFVKRGILFVGYHHPSFSHKNSDIQYTLDAYERVFSLLKTVLDKGKLRSSLEGKSIGAFDIRKI